MSDNKGIIGPDSLRLGGQSIDELPFAAAQQTKQQIPEFLATEKLNKIARIKARYPTQTVDWCDGAMRECRGNLQNVSNFKREQESNITEYKALISQVRRRDRKLAETTDEAEIKAIKKQFPPYDRKAMKTQVGQFKAAINRCDEVIEKERQNIKELMELRAKCDERDNLLKSLEAA